MVVETSIINPRSTWE